jgi:hypothetical protein
VTHHVYKVAFHTGILPDVAILIRMTGIRRVVWSRVLLEKLSVRSDGQEIIYLFWNSKVHYRVHKSLPPVSILSEKSRVLTF